MSMVESFLPFYEIIDQFDSHYLIRQCSAKLLVNDVLLSLHPAEVDKLKRKRTKIVSSSGFEQLF